MNRLWETEGVREIGIVFCDGWQFGRLLYLHLTLANLVLELLDVDIGGGGLSGGGRLPRKNWASQWRSRGARFTWVEMGRRRVFQKMRWVLEWKNFNRRARSPTWASLWTSAKFHRVGYQTWFTHFTFFTYIFRFRAGFRVWAEVHRVSHQNSTVLVSFHLVKRGFFIFDCTWLAIVLVPSSTFLCNCFPFGPQCMWFLSTWLQWLI